MNRDKVTDKDNGGNARAVPQSELIERLGTQVGLAAWDVDHGQPDMPDLFECREDHYHFPCGMCNYRASEPELRCVGCRHYCP